MAGLLDKILPSGLVGKVVDAVSQHIPLPADQNKRMELEAAIEQAVIAATAQVDVAQAEVNKVDAASSNRWNSGWRPAIGWSCAWSLIAYYPVRIVLMMIIWLIVAIKAAVAGVVIPPVPEVGIGDIIGLTVSMLGSATLRTVEKAKGVQANH